MEGIEKILARIETDAKDTAAEILREAENYRAERLKEADLRAKEILDNGEKVALDDAKTLIYRAESQAEALRRRGVLERRQARIENVINMALQHLAEKSVPEKIDLYLQMLGQAAIKSGEIVLGQVDSEMRKPLLQKLPDGFTVAEEFAPIRGGFLVKKDEITENLSFDLFIRTRRRELEKYVSTQIETERPDD